MLIASKDKKLRIWDVESRVEIANLSMGPNSDIRAFAVSPDGTLALTSTTISRVPVYMMPPVVHSSTMRIWHVRRPVPDTSKPFEKAISSPTFSPDGKRPMISRNREAEPSKPLPDKLQSFYFYAESPDGRTVLVADKEKDWSAQLWDLKSETHLASLDVEETVSSAAFSPDGKRIVTAGGDSTPRLWNWDAKDRKLKLHKLLKGNLPHEKVTITAAYSPDGRRVVTTSEDGTARTWDAESGLLVAVLKVVENWVRAAAFSPDGARIIAAGRVWDTESGEMIALLAEGGGKLDVAFSPDGRRVAYGDQVWFLRPPARDEPECLRLSVEIRTRLAWDRETRRPYDLSDKELSERRKRLDDDYKGKFCDAREWDDLSEGERAALRGPGRK